MDLYLVKPTGTKPEQCGESGDECTYQLLVYVDGETHTNRRSNAPSGVLSIIHGGFRDAHSSM